MRIVLNAELLSRQQSFRTAGISRVIYYLLAELARDARGHSFHVFVPTAPEPGDPLAAGSLTFHTTGERTGNPNVRIAWEQTLYPANLLWLRPRLVHNLAYASPLVWNGPTVLTVYDLSFFRFPSAFKPANRAYLAGMTRLSARRARRIVTISEHTKSDIVQILGIHPDKIDVCYPAADERYRPLPTDEVEAFRAANQLPEEMLFSVGTLEPRKNLLGLLQAYAQLPTPRPPLYVAGAAGWRFSPIFDEVQRLGLEPDVHFLGYVSEEVLPLWYNAARLFAYPSLYEGFGLPVLEAMACGTPVITSNVSSLPEVAGKAGSLVSPHDTVQLATEMRRVLEDANLRNAMRAAGRIQASRFTWRSMADQTVASYERAAGVRRRATVA